MEENKNGTQEQPEQKKKKKSDVLLTIALVVAIAVFCYAAYNLYHIYTEYRKGTNEYNSIEEMAVTERDPDSTEVAGPDAQPKPPIDVDFEKLKSRCTAGYQLSDRAGKGQSDISSSDL